MTWTSNNTLNLLDCFYYYYRFHSIHEWNTTRDVDNNSREKVSTTLALRKTPTSGPFTTSVLTSCLPDWGPDPGKGSVVSWIVPRTVTRPGVIYARRQISVSSSSNWGQTATTINTRSGHQGPDLSVTDYVLAWEGLRQKVCTTLTRSTTLSKVTVWDKEQLQWQTYEHQLLTEHTSRV